MLVAAQLVSDDGDPGREREHEQAHGIATPAAASTSGAASSTTEPGEQPQVEGVERARQDA